MFFYQIWSCYFSLSLSVLLFLNYDMQDYGSSWSIFSLPLTIFILTSYPSFLSFFFFFPKVKNASFSVFSYEGFSVCLIITITLFWIPPNSVISFCDGVTSTSHYSREEKIIDLYNDIFSFFLIPHLIYYASENFMCFFYSSYSSSRALHWAVCSETQVFFLSWC